MERIIEYNEIPFSRGNSIYLNMQETDPKIYIELFSKGYKIVKDVRDANKKTIYVTRCRETYEHKSEEEFNRNLEQRINGILKASDITKPNTENFSYKDLVELKYNLPFVLKNENLNRGIEKFLIQNGEDYYNLIKACELVKNMRQLEDLSVQEYIQTPTEYNTTVRLLTSPNGLLYSTLKYKMPTKLDERSTWLGILLSNKYPLTTKSIVSNTASGGENILLGENDYTKEEQRILDAHNIYSQQFQSLVQTACDVHAACGKELGILCGFDFIYDENRKKWYLLEFHTKPMVGDYSRRQNIKYETREDRIIADGRVRATALNKVLQKTR